MSGKRKDYTNWDEVWMSIAAVLSTRSKDPKTQHGVVVVSPSQHVLTVGYNGMPKGCSYDEFPWTRGDPDTPFEDTKAPYSRHAEANALDNCEVRSLLKGATMYLYSERGYWPCYNCAQGILNREIREVVIATSNSDPEIYRKYGFEATRRMFHAAGVHMRLLNNEPVVGTPGGVYRRTLLTGSGVLRDMSRRLLTMADGLEEIECPKSTT